VDQTFLPLSAFLTEGLNVLFIGDVSEKVCFCSCATEECVFMLGSFFDDCFDFVLGEEFFCYKVLKFWKRLQVVNVLFFLRAVARVWGEPVRGETRPSLSLSSFGGGGLKTFLIGTNFEDEIFSRCSLTCPPFTGSPPVSSAPSTAICNIIYETQAQQTASLRGKNRKDSEL
jgi:hypothetical protein